MGSSCSSGASGVEVGANVAIKILETQAQELLAQRAARLDAVAERLIEQKKERADMDKMVKFHLSELKPFGLDQVALQILVDGRPLVGRDYWWRYSFSEFDVATLIKCGFSDDEVPSIRASLRQFSQTFTRDERTYANSHRLYSGHTFGRTLPPPGAAQSPKQQPVITEAQVQALATDRLEKQHDQQLFVVSADHRLKLAELKLADVMTVYDDAVRTKTTNKNETKVSAAAAAAASGPLPPITLVFQISNQYDQLRSELVYTAEELGSHLYESIQECDPWLVLTGFVIEFYDTPVTAEDMASVKRAYEANPDRDTLGNIKKVLDAPADTHVYGELMGECCYGGLVSSLHAANTYAVQVTSSKVENSKLDSMSTKTNLV